MNAYQSLFHCHYCEGGRPSPDEVLATAMPWYQHPLNCCYIRELALLYEPALLPYIASYIVEPTISGLTSSTPGLLEGKFHWDPNNRQAHWEIEPPTAIPPTSAPYGIASDDNERGIVASHHARLLALGEIRDPIKILCSRRSWTGRHDIMMPNGLVLGHVRMGLIQRRAYLTDTQGHLLALFICENYGEGSDAPRKFSIFVPHHETIVPYTRQSEVTTTSHYYTNQQPTWHDGMQAYILQFQHLRVKEKSVKNFVIRDDGRFVMQFGRIKDNRSVFILDVDAPFSPLIAYAAAIVSCCWPI